MPFKKVDTIEELKDILASSLDEFMIIYSVNELAEILIDNVNYKELCAVINKINE